MECSCALKHWLSARLHRWVVSPQLRNFYGSMSYFLNGAGYAGRLNILTSSPTMGWVIIHMAVQHLFRLPYETCAVMLSYFRCALQHLQNNDAGILLGRVVADPCRLPETSGWTLRLKWIPSLCGILGIKKVRQLSTADLFVFPFSTSIQKNYMCRYFSWLRSQSNRICICQDFLSGHSDWKLASGSSAVPITPERLTGADCVLLRRLRAYCEFAQHIIQPSLCRLGHITRTICASWG